MHVQLVKAYLLACRGSILNYVNLFQFERVILLFFKVEMDARNFWVFMLYGN